jgi:hypothetical protein
MGRNGSCSGFYIADHGGDVLGTIPIGQDAPDCDGWGYFF